MALISDFVIPRCTRHGGRCNSTELDRANGVSASGRGIWARQVFVLRSLPAWLDEISGRFSSSLPPPSFARGRFATLFFPVGA
jgi:hypothetical protein